MYKSNRLMAIINKLKLELEQLYSKKRNLLDPEIIAKSQKLDKFILRELKRKISKI